MGHTQQSRSWRGRRHGRVTEETAVLVRARRAHGVAQVAVLLLGSGRERGRRMICRRLNWQNPELMWRVCEKAHLSLALLPVFASLGSVPGRVEPTLEHSVRELAAVAAAARPTAVVRAHGARIVVAARIPAAGLLAWVGEGAVGPVVAAAAGAAADFELEHTEVVGGVGVGRVSVVFIGVVSCGVVGEELAEEGLVGGGEAGGVHIRRGGGEVLGLGAAGEELSGWDVNGGVVERLLG